MAIGYDNTKKQSLNPVPQLQLSKCLVNWDPLYKGLQMLAFQRLGECLPLIAFEKLGVLENYFLTQDLKFFLSDCQGKNQFVLL